MTSYDDYLTISSNNNLSYNSSNTISNASEIVMEGWVLRKKQLQVSYKKYYMIAKRRQSKAGILCFYKTENDPQSQPCSTIDLSECTDINSTIINNYSSQRYEFKLYLRKHDLLLATNSHETTEKWIEAIKQLLPRISKPAYDSLQQEVNSLRSSESNLKNENAKLLELIEHYKMNVKNLEETNKQLEGEITRLKDELSLFKLENSNQQITNNNMHIKNLNHNMTKNLDKIYNKVSEQEKIEDIFKNGVNKLDGKLDQYSDDVKETMAKNEGNNQLLNEKLDSIKEMVEERTHKIEEMISNSEEQIKLAAKEEGINLEKNTSYLKNVQAELNSFSKEVPATIEIIFKKVLDETLKARLETMTQEMNTMSQNQAKLLEICSNTAENIKTSNDNNKNVVNEIVAQIESNFIDNKNMMNLSNENMIKRLDDLTEYIANNSQSSNENMIKCWMI